MFQWQPTMSLSFSTFLTRLYASPLRRITTLYGYVHVLAQLLLAHYINDRTLHLFYIIAPHRVRIFMHC